MLGKRSWREIIESDEARVIRESAAKSYKLRRGICGRMIRQERRVMIQDESSATMPPACSTAGHSTDDNVDSDGLMLNYSDLSTVDQCQPSSTLARPLQGLQIYTEPSIPMDRIWWDGSMPKGHGPASSSLQIMMTFLEDIFPLEYGFYALHHRHQDRSWLLNALLDNEPLYHATLGLCISFELGKDNGTTQGYSFFNRDVRTLQNSAIRGLRLRVAELGSGEIEDEVCLRKAVQALSIISQLLSIEIFNTLGGEWEMHLQAAMTLLGMLQMKWASNPSEASISTIGVDVPARFLTSPMSTDQQRTLEFFVTAFVWVDIMAGAATGPRRFRHHPKFNYLPLLHQKMIQPRRIMGCQTPIMIAMAKITETEAWKEEQEKRRCLDLKHLSTKLSTVEANIKGCIQEVGLDPTTPLTPTSLEADSNAVTVLYAYAALIYLHVVLSGPLPQNPGIEENVTRCLEMLEVLPPRLFMRVCWPFTVAGCMATETQYERFQALLPRVLAERVPPGLTWKGLLVMEKCWHLRSSGEDGECYWRTAMKGMGLKILFI